MPKVYDRIMTTRPSGKQSRVEAAKKILLPFARRAFRRPVKPEEIERYLKLVKLAESQGDSFDKGVGLAIQAILVSPHFLFLVEKDPDENDKDGIRQLSEHELATRLSYFLWSTMPDEELFQLAEKGELRKNLKAQIKRMLKDKRSHSLVESFGGQWLQLRNLKSHDPDPDTFPKYSTQLRADMIKETEMFFETIIKEDRSILDFIDADFTFLNRRLAGHYGMWRAVRSRGFQRVSLAKDSPRGGILTMGSILTVTSNPTRTSPVKRGKWILENLLNAAPPPPPPDAGELEEGKKLEEAASLRKRLEMHRSKPSCAICHARMDPLGFALENFDGVGSWRWKNGNHNIDARADLPTGEKFKGPSELKKVLLKRKDQFARCLAEKMLTYAMGRGTDYYDRCAVDEIVKAMKKNNYRFSTMIEKIVESEPFQLRKR